jgi:hypothetical protein
MTLVIKTLHALILQPDVHLQTVILYYNEGPNSSTLCFNTCYFTIPNAQLTLGPSYSGDCSGPKTEADFGEVGFRGRL